MYGIVNKALQEMVCNRYGETTWAQILILAQVSDEVFISNEAYPDDTTYALVSTASAHLAVPIDQLLEQFGRYWVLETGQRSYGHLLKTGGETLRDFLINLPNFHARIFLIYPNLQPPEFVCEQLGPQQMKIKYFSHRSGLAHFVIGLLYGLGELFATPVAVEQIKVRASEQDCDEFLVAW